MIPLHQHRPCIINVITIRHGRLVLGDLDKHVTFKKQKNHCLSCTLIGYDTILTSLTTNDDLKTVLTSTAEQLTNKQTVLNLLQSRNIFFLTTITLLTCYLFLSNSSNLIVTVYAKLERHISSIEVKLLNL